MRKFIFGFAGALIGVLIALGAAIASGYDWKPGDGGLFLYMATVLFGCWGVGAGLYVGSAK